MMSLNVHAIKKYMDALDRIGPVNSKVLAATLFINVF